jgi:hypothetical protein
VNCCSRAYHNAESGEAGDAASRPLSTARANTFSHVWLLLLEVFCTPGTDYICRQVHRQLMRNELARFYHYRTRNCIPPRKLRQEIQ